MAIAYSILFAISLLLPVGYYAFVRKVQKESWVLILFTSVCIIDFGYLLLSLSKTVEFALLANKIVYFGQVFMPLCMFMLISKLSGFRYKKWVKAMLVCFAMLMFALVLTTGHLDWYYKSVELTFVDGAAKLVKEYGFLHPTNLVYVLSYFVAMIVVIGISLKKNKGKSQKLAGLMLVVVLGNIGMWIVEKLIALNFEFLSISYLMSELVFFFVYWMLQDYIRKADVPVAEERVSVIFVDSEQRAQNVQRIVDSLPKGTVLTARQLDILEGILAGKSRKEIAVDLHLSENTVKMHTTALFKTLKVSSREEIFALIGK